MTPNTQDLVITIPAAIAAVPDTTLLEKAALAHIAKHPSCSNARLASILGITVRGVESMLRRLRERELIRQIGLGRAREHHLTFPVEHHNECGIVPPTKSHSPCEEGNTATSAVARRRTVEDDIDDHLMASDICFRRGRYEYAGHHLEHVEKLARTLPLPADETAKLLAVISKSRNRVIAFQFLSENAKQLSPPQLERAASAIRKATPETLARFRQRLDEHALAGDALQILAPPPG